MDLDENNAKIKVVGICDWVQFYADPNKKSHLNILS